MTGDYATNARVDDLVGRLRADLVATERLLRDHQDEKEKQLRSEFVAAVQASEDRTHARLDDIDEHLSTQDEWLVKRHEFWKNWRYQLLLFVLASVLGTLVLHVGFHLP